MVFRGALQDSDVVIFRERGAPGGQNRGVNIRRGEINLYVSDIPRAVKFYTEALGMRRISDPVFGEPDGSWDKVTSGELTLTLFKAQSAEHAIEPGSRPGMTADLLVDDMDLALKRLESVGAKVGEVRGWRMGRVVNVKDPDGTSWELISHEKAPPSPEIRHVVLNASNIEKSRAFYAKTLGLPLLESEKNFFVFRSGSIRVSVFPGGKKLAAKGPVPNVKLMFEVARLKDAIAKLKRKKVKFLGEIEEAPGFMRYVTLADPDNNVLFLAQYLRDPLLAYP